MSKCARREVIFFFFFLKSHYRPRSLGFNSFCLLLFSFLPKHLVTMYLAYEHACLLVLLLSERTIVELFLFFSFVLFFAFFIPSVGALTTKKLVSLNESPDCPSNLYLLLRTDWKWNWVVVAAVLLCRSFISLLYKTSCVLFFNLEICCSDTHITSETLPAGKISVFSSQVVESLRNV